MKTLKQIAMADNAAANLMEGSLNELYTRPSFLTPTWRIIFQEAMRGHHILFYGQYAPELMKKPAATRRSLTLANVMTDAVQDSKLVETACEIFQANDIAKMRRLIRSLDAADRDRLYLIYENQLQNWKARQRREMN